MFFILYVDNEHMKPVKQGLLVGIIVLIILFEGKQCMYQFSEYSCSCVCQRLYGDLLNTHMHD